MYVRCEYNMHMYQYTMYIHTHHIDAFAENSHLLHVSKYTASEVVSFIFDGANPATYRMDSSVVLLDSIGVIQHYSDGIWLLVDFSNGILFIENRTCAAGSFRCYVFVRKVQLNLLVSIHLWFDTFGLFSYHSSTRLPFFLDLTIIQCSNMPNLVFFSSSASIEWI